MAVTTQKLAASYKLPLNRISEFCPPPWSVNTPLSAKAFLSYQPEIRRISAYKLAFTGCVLGTCNVVNITEHQAAQMPVNTLPGKHACLQHCKNKPFLGKLLDLT